jgi:ABC-type branched-subunit amino acid transport system substrate-binding protein
VPTRSRAFALRGAACVVAALAVAGCSQTSASSKSSDLTVKGDTLTIVISEPSGLKADPAAQDIVNAEKMAYFKDRSEVKDYKVVLFPVESKTLSDNARTAIDADNAASDTAIAYLGEIAPGASDQTVGITNALDMLEVSPTDTAAELTENTTASEQLYQSWGVFGRTFARVSPSSVQEAAAQVAEMKSLGVSSLYVVSDGSDYGDTVAQAVRSHAKAAGIDLTTSMSAAGGIFYGVQSPAAAATFFNHAASVAPNAKLFGPSSLDSGLFTSAVSSSVHNLYVTIPGVMPKQLNAAGKAFEKDFAGSYGHKPNVEAVFGYEAMASLLSVLRGAGESANARGTVVSDFLKQSQSDSVLGSFKLNGTGNSSLDAFVIARLSAGTLVPFKAAPA